MPDLTVITPEPAGKAVIDYLEHVLEQARDGRISSIAIAKVYRDGSTGSGFSEQRNLATMVGAVEALKAKLVADMIE